MSGIVGVKPMPRAKSALPAPDRNVRRSATGLLTRPLVLRVVSVVVVFALWQIIGVHTAFSTSYPSAIVRAANATFTSQVLPAFRDTAWGFFVGYLICVIVGLPVGLAMARLRVVELALEPYVSALYATPRVALIPVLILWLGVGFKLRVGVVIISGLFPIVLNAYIGGKEVDRNLIDAGTAFKASRLQMLRTVIIPGSLPYVFAGLRIGLGRSLIGIVVAEIEASALGLGNLINVDAQNLELAAMFVPIICLGIFSLACSVLLRRGERWATMPWERTRRLHP